MLSEIKKFKFKILLERGKFCELQANGKNGLNEEVPKKKTLYLEHEVFLDTNLRKN